MSRCCKVRDANLISDHQGERYIFIRQRLKMTEDHNVQLLSAGDPFPYVTSQSRLEDKVAVDGICDMY